jgi:hypothetical protein
MEEEYTLFTAVESLRPLPKLYWVGTEYSGLEWQDSRPKPTEEELNIELKRLKDEYDSQQWSRDRATDYPAIADQLDDIFHNGIDGWKATIQLTKDKYPKGGN